MTKLTALLAEAGLLQEAPATTRSSTSLGRPRVPVIIDPDRYRVIGVHIGLIRTSVCQINLRGEVIDQRRIAHRDHRPGVVLTKTVDCIRSVIDNGSGASLAVGVSTGGWVDSAHG